MGWLPKPALSRRSPRSSNAALRRIIPAIRCSCAPLTISQHLRQRNRRSNFQLRLNLPFFDAANGHSGYRYAFLLSG